MSVVFGGFFFFKQKTAYEMRISDWSSDLCFSDLMAAFWGQGQSASSDGQFFLATEQGEAMNLINAKYGNVPGLKGYSHVSDQYAPFATQVIPATVSEAPYILDGLLMNDAGRRVRQHFADTGGFT